MLQRILWGRDWQYRIRKDAGDLRISDFDQFPVWEFCLDEEGRRGQTECTVRPSRRVSPIELPEFDGGIRAALTFGCGKSCVGIVWQTGTGEAENATVDILLPQVARELTRVKLPRYSQIVDDSSWRVGFVLAAQAYLPDAEVRALIPVVYSMFGMTRHEFWPITVRPRVAVQHWPASWTFRGWKRVSGETFE